jgi:hypothetical protein
MTKFRLQRKRKLKVHLERNPNTSSRRHFLYGASDKQGARPDRNPVRPEDLAATMFHLLGIDPGTEVHDTQNRPLVIAAGNPIAGVLA